MPGSGESRADGGSTGGATENVHETIAGTEAPPLIGLLPKCTVNRQSETLTTDQAAGRLSGLCTLRSSLTSCGGGGVLSEGQKLCPLVWELGTETQGHLLGGTEA